MLRFNYLCFFVRANYKSEIVLECAITLCNIHNLTSWSFSSYQFKDTLSLYSITGSSFFITATAIFGLSQITDSKLLLASALGLYLVDLCKWYRSYSKVSWLHKLVEFFHYFGAFACAVSGLTALYWGNVFSLNVMEHVLIGLGSIIVMLIVHFIKNKNLKIGEKIGLLGETYCLYVIFFSYSRFIF
ncbi:MAG: hypothetical protein Ta2D_12390 [Rickettsiales bacterium]|nr:MAG: hypothetical protein Ta2D_12390 [Rickettsiales bacterium]